MHFDVAADTGTSTFSRLHQTPVRRTFVRRTFVRRTLAGLYCTNSVKVVLWETEPLVPVIVIT